MQKIYFQCDYAEGAHPKILARLAATNLEQRIFTVLRRRKRLGKRVKTSHWRFTF